MECLSRFVRILQRQYHNASHCIVRMVFCHSPILHRGTRSFSAYLECVSTDYRRCDQCHRQVIVSFFRRDDMVYFASSSGYFRTVQSLTRLHGTNEARMKRSSSMIIERGCPRIISNMFCCWQNLMRASIWGSI